MKREILLGATDNNELVFAEVSNMYGFTVSFNVVSPLEVTNELIETRMENQLDCLSREELFDICERYDCRPSEILENVVDDVYNVEDVLDISLYPESYRVEGIEDDVYFESGACGQCGEYVEKVTKYCFGYPIIDHILTNWRLHHLEKLDEEVSNEIFNFIDLIVGEDYWKKETEWVQNWLETEVYPL